MTPMRDGGGFIGRMLFMTAGLLVWALHFAVVYGFNAVACSRSFASDKVLGFGVVGLVIGAATVLAWVGIIAILASAVRGYARAPSAGDSEAAENFIRYTAAAVAMLSLLAVAWNALPALIVRPC